MKIGFDLDGVLYPWHYVVYDSLHKSGIIPDFSYEYFWKNYLSFQDILESILEEKDFYRIGEPFRGAVETLNKYHKAGHELSYVTQRPKSTYYVSIFWLLLWEFPQADENFYLFTDKIDFIRKQEYDYYVEDRGAIIDKIKDKTNAIGIKQPWNEVGWNNGVTWINSIMNLPEVIKV